MISSFIESLPERLLRLDVWRRQRRDALPSPRKRTPLWQAAIDKRVQKWRHRGVTTKLNYVPKIHLPHFHLRHLLNETNAFWNALLSFRLLSKHLFDIQFKATSFEWHQIPIALNKRVFLKFQKQICYDKAIRIN